jgi:hypothetical protein
VLPLIEEDLPWEREETPSVSSELLLPPRPLAPTPLAAIGVTERDISLLIVNPSIALFAESDPQAIILLDALEEAYHLWLLENSLKALTLTLTELTTTTTSTT